MKYDEFHIKLNQKLTRDKEKAKQEKDKEKVSKEKASEKFNKLSREMVEAFFMAEELEKSNISIDGKLIAKYTTGCHINNKFGIICKTHFRPYGKGVRNLDTIGIIVSTGSYDCYNRYFVEISTLRLKKYYCCGGEFTDKTTSLTSSEIKNFTKSYVAWRKSFDTFVKEALQ